MKRATLVVVGVACIVACAPPTQRSDSIALESGFTEALIQGAQFRHRIYRKNFEAPVQALHVYIEGDGVPYHRRFIVASDPTPRSPLMLRLMRADPAPSVYVGRPCYFGLARDVNCDARYWTLGRFAPEVIESMAVAIRAEAARAQARDIVLFGHSGGGTLAVLVAQHLQPQVRKVVTLAGTLDIDAWTDLHRYTRLKGSVNPVHQPRMESVELVHFVGSEDRNVPPEIVTAAAEKIGGRVEIIKGFTHGCCWDRRWPPD